MKKTIFPVIAFLVIALASPALAAEELGVYVKAVEKSQGTFDETVKALEDGLSKAGFEVLASYAAGVEERCGLRVHVIVADNKQYTGKIISHGPMAAFALPLRVGVYEDESGVHVDFANPASINRTVLGDEVETELSADMAKSLQEAIASSVKGTAVNTQAGQMRVKGHVGGMGGGDFNKKVETFHEGGNYAEVLSSIRTSAEANDKGWRLVYSMEPAPDITLLGLTQPATEARAFDIAGQKRQEKDFKCPGLDHAPAFPIEVVVSEEDGRAMVRSLDEMYRMKLYFEDAGNWAFMKNMTMPGNIQDELEDVTTSGLK